MIKKLLVVLSIIVCTFLTMQKEVVAQTSWSSKMFWGKPPNYQQLPEIKTDTAGKVLAQRLDGTTYWTKMTATGGGSSDTTGWNIATKLWATTYLQPIGNYLTSLPSHTHSINSIIVLQDSLTDSWNKRDTATTLSSKSFMQTYVGNRFQPIGSYLTSETYLGTVTSITMGFGLSSTQSPLTTTGTMIVDTSGPNNPASKPWIQTYTTNRFQPIGSYAASSHNHSWSNITSGLPTTLSGYGITDGMSTSHAANGITNTNITNWNTAYSWGNHSGLYRPIAYVPAWSEITSKPTTLSGFGITDAAPAASPTLTGTTTVDVLSGNRIDQVWWKVTASYASTSTFTFTGTQTDCFYAINSLYRCVSSNGQVLKAGYIKSATYSSGTVTCTVVGIADLASGDKNWGISINRKINDYRFLITIPGEQIADAAVAKGNWLGDLMDTCYLMPVNISVLSAASGSSPDLTYNVYKTTTAMFTTPPTLGSNTVLKESRPDAPPVSKINPGENVTLKIITSTGTAKARDFQAKLFLVPSQIFYAY